MTSTQQRHGNVQGIAGGIHTSFLQNFQLSRKNIIVDTFCNADKTKEPDLTVL
jgi:hypothetical protein